MTENEAYRKGQEDMRRRISEEWSGWYASLLTACSKNYRPDVSVKIRATPIRNMPADDLNDTVPGVKYD